MESWTNPAVPVNITLRCEIYVCKVPDLDMTYQNTYTFKNKEAQIAFFKSKAKYSYTNAGVTKYGRNWKIRLPECAENIIDCNYVVFQNTNYQTTGFKYYYGFISNIVWNNGSECEIDYVFDVFQTWLFEIKWGRSYIERTHIYSSLDTPYYTTASEPFPQYEYGGYSNFSVGNSLGVMIQVAPPNTSEINGKDYNGIFSQHDYYYCPYNSQKDAIDVGLFIDDYVKAHGDNSLINCYTFPAFAINNMVGTKEGNYNIFKLQDMQGSDGNPIRTPFTQEVSFRNTGTFDGYTIVNKKLLQYPFTTLYLYDGKNIQYFPKEFIKQSTVGQYKIVLQYSMMYPPVVRVQLEGYKTIAAGELGDIFTTQLSGYPSCGTYANTYLNYLNTVGGEDYRRMGYIGALTNTTYRTAMSGATSIASAGLGGYPLNPFMQASMMGYGGLNITNQFLNNMRDDYLASYNAGQSSGGIGGNVEAGLRKIQLRYGHAWYPVEVLKRIDRFFTMYGYQINDTGIPNINARSKWVYLKIGTPCNIGGNIPMGHKEVMIEALHRGMTFWHGDYIGDYTQVNS